MHPQIDASSSTSDFHLRDYFRVLRRRKLLIIIPALVVFGSALAASLLQTPVYQATAQMLLQPRQSESAVDEGQSPQKKEQDIKTDIQLLRSEAIKAEVKRVLGAAPRVSAAPIGQTQVVGISAEHTDPKQATAIANAYMDAYINVRRTQDVDDLLKVKERLAVTATALQQQIDPIVAQLPNIPVSDMTPSQQALLTRRDLLVQEQFAYQEELNRLDIAAQLKAGGAREQNRATVPDSPIRPTPERTGALALAIGLIFGIGLAFLFEYLDDSIKTKEDLERAAPGLSVLGMIPAVAAWKARDEPQVVSTLDPTSTYAEAYRTLRTSIQFLTLGQPLRTLQVTSANAGEGKTTTLANLGVALAMAGQRVIIAGCDLRRPRIHEFFGIDDNVGLTSVMLGEVPLTAALRPVPGVDRLLVLPAGPRPPNPSELLASRRCAEVLTTLQAQADLVLLDCPPVLPVTDAAVLSARVDATLVVATAGSTARKELARTVELLAQVNAPVIGTVLNGVTADSGYGYQYYRYRYEADPATGETSSRRSRSDLRAPAAK